MMASLSFSLFDTFLCVFLKVRNDKSEAELVASYLLGRTNKKRQPIVGSDEAPFKTKGADLSEMGEKFIRKFYIPSLG